MSNGAVQQKLGVVALPYAQEICCRQQIIGVLGSILAKTQVCWALNIFEETK